MDIDRPIRGSQSFLCVLLSICVVSRLLQQMVIGTLWGDFISHFRHNIYMQNINICSDSWLNLLSHC